MMARFDVSVLWILLFTVVCVVIQVSFSLPQDVIPEIQRNNAESNKNFTTMDEEINSHVEEPTEIDDVSNGTDSRNCFPYFIYQDVESLLNQALKMFSVSRTEHQRSWLQLFIHRLESLLTQLRRLPIKYANYCIRIKDRLNPSLLTDTDLSSAPEPVQHQLTKKLFLASKHRFDKKHHLNDRLKEYITGRVHGRNKNAAIYEIANPVESEVISKMPHQSNNAHFIHQSNKDIDAIPSNLENPDTNLDAAVDKSSSSYVKSNNPYADILIPITFWEKQNMNPETMPFLPRATRKVEHPISEKMRFRALSAHSKHVDTSTSGDEQDEHEIQTRLPPPSDDHASISDHKQHSEDITSTLVFHPEDTNITPPTQHHKESVSRSNDHDTNWTPSTNASTSIPNQNIDTSTDDDDDLVIQLHSGGKLYKQQMDPRVLIKGKPIDMKTWPHAIPEGQSNIPESAEIPNSKEQDSSEELTDAGIATNENDAEMVPILNENRNNLDFDYEEPGAAAGELFIDDEVIPIKYLTVPSSVSSVTNYDENQDDVVRQLDELKSSKSDSVPLSDPIILTESAPVKSIEDNENLPDRHLVNNK